MLERKERRGGEEGREGEGRGEVRAERKGEGVYRGHWRKGCQVL